MKEDKAKGEKSQEGQGKKHRTFEKLPGPFFPILHELLKSPLLEKKMIDEKDFIVFTMMGSQKTGDRKHDSQLQCPYSKVKHLMGEPRFIKAKFRLWAYRMILVQEYGQKRRRASRFMIYNKWRTLIRMPEKLEKIHKLVKEYEKVHRQKLNPKTSIQTKREKLLNIKKKIREMSL